MFCIKVKINNNNHKIDKKLDNKCRICYKADEHLKHAQQLHHLNKLIVTIRWLVTSTGQHENILGYRLFKSTTNIYLKG